MNHQKEPKKFPDAPFIIVQENKPLLQVIHVGVDIEVFWYDVSPWDYEKTATKKLVREWMREGDIKSQHMQSCKHNHIKEQTPFRRELFNVMCLEKEGSDTSQSQDTSGSGSHLRGLSREQTWLDI